MWLRFRSWVYQNKTPSMPHCVFTVVSDAAGGVGINSASRLLYDDPIKVEALVLTTLQQGDEGFPVGITPKAIERVSLNF
jgi:hypothetical protein